MDGQKIWKREVVVGVVVALAALLVLFFAWQLPSLITKTGDLLSSVYLSLNPEESQEIIIPSEETKEEETTNDTEPVKPVTNVPGSAVTPGAESSNVYPISGGGGMGVEDPNGLPDFVPLVRAIGVLNPSTNVFTASPSVRYGERAAIQFAVENRGTKSSGTWNFSVALPTNPANTFNSEPQNSLRPGERIEYTLGFDSLDSLGGTTTINVNPSRTAVPELNYENNTVSVTITVTP